MNFDTQKQKNSNNSTIAIEEVYLYDTEIVCIHKHCTLRGYECFGRQCTIHAFESGAIKRDSARVYLLYQNKFDAEISDFHTFIKTNDDWDLKAMLHYEKHIIFDEKNKIGNRSSASCDFLLESDEIDIAIEYQDHSTHFSSSNSNYNVQDEVDRIVNIKRSRNKPILFLPNYHGRNIEIPINSKPISKLLKEIITNYYNAFINNNTSYDISKAITINNTEIKIKRAYNYDMNRHGQSRAACIDERKWDIINIIWFSIYAIILHQISNDSIFRFLKNMKVPMSPDEPDVYYLDIFRQNTTSDLKW